MSTVYVWPAPGRDCPWPEKGGELLPAEGADVPLNAFWQRRINDGDALETNPALAAAEPSGEPAAEPVTKPKPARSTKV